MPECYIGRGKLYARRLSLPLSGFVQVTGESEVTLSLTEEAGDVTDSRYGRAERVDWFVKSIQATLSCEVFDHTEYSLALLLKGTKAIVAAGAGRTYLFPNGIELNTVYPVDRVSLLPGAVIRDSLATPLAAGINYKLDAPIGLVEFINLTGFIAPFTITYNNAIYSELGIATTNTIPLELLFRGFNRVSGNTIKAVFYHGELRITEAMKLISKGFTSLPFKVELLADMAHNVDDVLSHYGRITKV